MIRPDEQQLEIFRLREVNRELLAACKKAAAQYQGTFSENHVATILRAAIANATNRPAQGQGE